MINPHPIIVSFSAFGYTLAIVRDETFAFVCTGKSKCAQNKWNYETV